MTDVFLKIAEIKGESTDAHHKDEIEVLSWSWGVTHTISTAAGGGAASGRPTFNDFSFLHLLDKASPKLMRACAVGQHLRDATATERRPGPGRQEFLVIKLTDVLVTSVFPSGGGDGSPVEQVTLRCAKFDLEYRAQKPDGALDAGVRFAYDIASNKEG